jgi:hypothetical protein
MKKEMPHNIDEGLDRDKEAMSPLNDQSPISHEFGDDAAGHHFKHHHHE